MGGRGAVKWWSCGVGGVVCAGAASRMGRGVEILGHFRVLSRNSAGQQQQDYCSFACGSILPDGIATLPSPLSDL